MSKIIRKLIHDFLMLVIPNWIRKKSVTCEQAAKLMASEDPNRTWFMKLKLKMHVIICQNCIDYHHQLNIIEHTAKNIQHIDLDDAARARIRASLDRAMRNIK